MFGVLTAPIMTFVHQKFADDHCSEVWKLKHNEIQPRDRQIHIT